MGHRTFVCTNKLFFQCAENGSKIMMSTPGRSKYTPNYTICESSMRSSKLSFQKRYKDTGDHFVRRIVPSNPCALWDATQYPTQPTPTLQNTHIKTGCYQSALLHFNFPCVDKDYGVFSRFARESICHSFSILVCEGWMELLLLRNFHLYHRIAFEAGSLQTAYFSSRLCRQERI